MSRRDLEKKLQEKGPQRLRPAMPESGWKPSARWMTAPMPPHWCGTAAIWDTVPGGQRKAAGKGRASGALGRGAGRAAPDGEQIDRFLQSKLHGRSPEDKEKKRLTDALLRRGVFLGRGEVRLGPLWF